MILKKRRVKNGDYAVLEDDTSAEDALYFKSPEKILSILHIKSLN